MRGNGWGVRRESPGDVTGCGIDFLWPRAEPDARFGEGFSSGFPYRLLPFFLSRRCQIGLNGSPKRLNLRKTLHLADAKGCGNRFQENPPPGTILNPLE
jgi:hypothetical protein